LPKLTETSRIRFPKDHHRDDYEYARGHTDPDRYDLKAGTRKRSRLFTGNSKSSKDFGSRWRRISRPKEWSLKRRSEKRKEENRANRSKKELMESLGEKTEPEEMLRQKERDKEESVSGSKSKDTGEWR